MDKTITLMYSAHLDPKQYLYEGRTFGSNKMYWNRIFAKRSLLQYCKSSGILIYGGILSDD